MISIISLFSFSVLAYVFIKNVLHMFQQNRYEFGRYTKWLFSLKKDYFVLECAIYAIVMLLTTLLPLYFRYIVVIVLTLTFAAYLIVKESKKAYIKPLVYTARIKRTLVVFYLFEILMILGLLALCKDLIGIVGIVVILLTYVLIYPVALVLKPAEYFIKKKYENEARKLLNEQTSLIKIGITGSYGKTTTKNIITRILENKFFTLMTPESYNTPMGITRTIREHLKRVHEVFVCEMGADHVNDISYLMKMVNPKYGVVSSIGPQHLQTFKSQEAIVHEKMQAIELLPSDGVGFINMDNDFIASYPIQNVCKVVGVGIVNQAADIKAEKIAYNKDGASFSVKLNGKSYKFKTKLLGEHNITNILLGIALALELGIEIKEIQKAVESLPQVEHRLENKIINGYHFIDDAFNSNPSGCLYALKALSLMPNKRIIVTPGLIDLGKEENSANYHFGKNMVNTTDFVILVGKNQTKYIYKGLQDSGYDLNNVLVVDKVLEAFTYIYNHFTSEDTILLENDLPDAFNN